MWFGKTDLVTQADVTADAPLHPDGVDFENLVQCESAVRDIALGGSAVDVSHYFAVSATIIDARGVAHAPSDDLTSNDILGIGTTAYATEDVEFSSNEGVVTSVTRLVPQHQDAQPASRIIWTKTWKLGPDGWRILNSHASQTA